MGNSGWFEVTVYRVGESANKAPSDTFTAHTLTVRPDGNLKIEWEGGSHGFTAGSYDRFELKRVAPVKAKQRREAELRGCIS